VLDEKVEAEVKQEEAGKNGIDYQRRAFQFQYQVPRESIRL